VQQKERRANIKDKEKLNSIRAGAKTKSQEMRHGKTKTILRREEPPHRGAARIYFVVVKTDS